MGNSIALDSTGNYVVSGQYGANNMAVWRVRTDASLDPDFNSADVIPGMFSDAVNFNSRGLSLRLDSIGGIVVAGDSSSQTVARIWRLR